QGSREEVTVLLRSQQRGANLGWRVWEGTRCYWGPVCHCRLCVPAGRIHPSAGLFDHRWARVSRFGDPGAEGTYFYGDFCSGWIRSFRFEYQVVSPTTLRSGLGTVSQPSSFGYDGQGEMYVVSLSGRVWKIVPAS